MNTPNLFQISELVHNAITVQTLHPQAGWVPARPLGFQGLCLRRRVKIAWAVFRGRLDAVHWEPSMPEARVPQQKFRKTVFGLELPDDETMGDEAAVIAAISAASHYWPQP